ncbi:hypothetical protein [Microbispora bryophytorum]|uniref:hypothetical protein n=1 Tax=Microbispora bryophytorum TaxID=1460882 RepID=UPI0033CA215A
MGSITKLWTATQIMLLAEQGRVTVDTPVWETGRAGNVQPLVAQMPASGIASCATKRCRRLTWSSAPSSARSTSSRRRRSSSRW